jgi:tetratricopeptide (TPR) repeat protein
MGKKDWYRKTDWSPDIEKDFFARLGRARSTYHKAQYLRIQASYLQTQCSPPDYRAALRLLEHLILKFPDPNELGMAYLQKAKCHEALGQFQDALNSYKYAVQFSKDDRGVFTTEAPVHFALFAAKNHLTEYYSEALKNFKGSDVILIMPSVLFNAFSAMALMAADSGKKRKAQNLAKKALTLLQQNNMDMQIEPVDEEIKASLIQIAESKPSRWWKFWR